MSQLEKVPTTCSCGAVRGEAAAHSVSVIMTTYNSAPFVEMAVQSVLDQTHKNLELIVVDDASTDNTFGRLQRLVASDIRLRPIKMLKNRGTYWCKNIGLTRAPGCIVTFQDSDDVSNPERIEFQLIELLKHPHAVLCTCTYVKTDANGAVVLNRGQRERKGIRSPLFWKDAVIGRVGYFDSIRTSADDEFIRRVALVFGDSRTCHIDAPLYRARLREGSLTTSAAKSADTAKSRAKASNLSFLSSSRREYVRQFTSWHAKIANAGENPVMPFPIVRRPFPAPSDLLPVVGRAEDYVTASLASIPARENLLEQSVASILPQVDVLNVYLNGYRTMPAFLNQRKIRVVRSTEYGDRKDNGKFFFASSVLWGYHFTIDDDIVYPADYVQKNILKIEQYERQAIVGCHGVILANPLTRYMHGRTVMHFRRASESDRFVNVLGPGTTAYHVSSLQLSEDDFKEPGMADLWLAVAAKRRGVLMVSIERPAKWLVPLAGSADSILYAASLKDDTVQTEIARREGPWPLDVVLRSSRLISQWLKEFTIDELTSAKVDVDSCISAIAGDHRAHVDRNAGE